MAAKTETIRPTRRKQKELLQKGYIVTASTRYGKDYLRLDPSLTIEKEDINGFFAALEDILMAQSH